MAKLSFTDVDYGKNITVDWNSELPPTEDDVDDILNEARKTYPKPDIEYKGIEQPFKMVDTPKIYPEIANEDNISRSRGVTGEFGSPSLIETAKAGLKAGAKRGVSSYFEAIKIFAPKEKPPELTFEGKKPENIQMAMFPSSAQTALTKPEIEQAQEKLKPTESEEDILNRSGLTGKAFEAAGEMAVVLPQYLASGGIAGTATKAILGRFTPEVIKAALPTVQKILQATGNEQKFMPLIEKSIAEPVGFAMVGAATTPGGIKEKAIGAVESGAQALPTVGSTLAKTRAGKAATAAIGGAAIVKAMGGEDKDAIFNGLLQGTLVGIGNRSDRLIKTYKDNPTLANKQSTIKAIEKDLSSKAEPVGFSMVGAATTPRGIKEKAIGAVDERKEVPSEEKGQTETETLLSSEKGAEISAPLLEEKTNINKNNIPIEQKPHDEISYEDYKLLSEDKKRAIFESNPVIGKPGQRSFNRTLIEKTGNGKKETYVAVGDINGFAEYNNEIIGSKGTDELNKNIYDVVAKHNGYENTKNLHGDEYAVFGNSPEELQKNIKLAMEEISKIDVKDPDGTIHHPTMSWMIGKGKNYDEIGKIDPKKSNKNGISVDKTVGINYNSIKGADNIPDNLIVKRGLINENSLRQRRDVQSETQGLSNKGTTVGKETTEGEKQSSAQSPEIIPPKEPANVVPETAKPSIEVKKPQEEIKKTPEDIKAKIEELKQSEPPKIEQPEGTIAAGGLAYGKTLPKFIPGANLKTVINETLDLVASNPEAYTYKRALLDIADYFTPTIEKSRRGKISWEETKQAAEEWGTSAEKLLKRKTGEAYNNAQLHAAKEIMIASAQRFRKIQKEMFDKKQNGTFTEKDEAQLRLAMQEHAAVYAGYAGSRAEAGRALNALKIMGKLSSEKKVNELFDFLGGKELNNKVIEKILSADLSNDTALHTLLDKMSKATTMEKFNELWTAGLLTSPTTHSGNIISNILTSLYKPLLETPVAATLELPKALLGKKREVLYGQTGAQLYGLISAMPNALKNAIKVFQNENPISSEGKIELHKKGAIGGNLGKIIRTPFRALGAADEFFKSIIRESTIQGEAYKKSIENGIVNFKKMKETANNPTKDMLEKAEKEAQDRTFTKPLGNIGNAIMSLRNKIPQIYFLIPFVKTPANVAKYIIERTPVGFIDKAIKISKGKITNENISEELSKPIVGTGIMMFASLLANAGYITGAGPKEKAKRDALYKTGWQPYSIKIGNTYYNYNRLEPLSSLLGLSSDFVEIAKKYKNEEKLNKIIEFTSYSIAKNITSKTYAKGLSDFFQAISEPERYGSNWIKSLGSSIIPGISGTIARSIDDKMREQEGIREAMMAKIPGVSMMLEPKLDHWGQEMDRSGNFWTRLLSPVQFNAAKGDKVDEEIVRLDANLSVPTKKISIPKKIIDKENLKEKYFELKTKEYNVFMKEAGFKAKLAITELINSEDYKGLDDDDKKDLIEKIYKKQINIVRSKEKYKRVEVYF